MVAREDGSLLCALIECMLAFGIWACVGRWMLDTKEKRSGGRAKTDMLCVRGDGRTERALKDRHCDQDKTFQPPW